MDAEIPWMGSGIKSADRVVRGTADTAFIKGKSQGGIRCRADRPVWRHPIKAIHNRGKIGLSGRDGEFRDVGKPFLIRFFRMEAPVCRIWHRRRALPLIGVIFPPALAPDHKPVSRYDPARCLLGDDGSPRLIRACILRCP